VYSAFLGNRSAVGQRSTTMVVRLDAHAADTTAGLLWRRNSVAAAAAATQRIVKALRQNNCHAEILNAAQMRESAAAGVGGAEVLGATFADRWTALRQPGHGFVISYFFSAADLTGPNLDAVGSYDADHTALVVALRRNTTGVSVSALVRYTTIQPTPPAQTASSTGSRGASGIRCWTRCQVHGG
jgi:type VII secretion protein EccE